MREQTAPGVWTDMGPERAIRHRHGFETLGGAIVTAPRWQPHRIRTTVVIPPQQPVCGHALTHWRNRFMAAEPTGELCQRRPLHTTEHRSAYAMANAAARRRKRP